MGVWDLPVENERCHQCNDLQRKIDELRAEKLALENVLSRVWGFQLADLELAAKVKEAKPLIKALAEILSPAQDGDE